MALNRRAVAALPKSLRAGATQPTRTIVVPPAAMTSNEASAPPPRRSDDDDDAVAVTRDEAD